MRSRSNRNPPETRRTTGGLFAPLPQAPLDHRQRIACLRLIRSDNVGPVTFRELINHFGGAEKALDALPEMSRRAGHGRPIRIFPRDKAEAELDAARKIGAEPIFTIEPGYPRLLAYEDVPPPLLYTKGRSALLHGKTVALVGSRNASAAGVTLTRMIAAGLGAAGIVVVSGLARGVDGAAHEAAIETGTVAVVAGGIDFIYPPEHADLHARLARDGCIVSEQPPGFQPRGQDFPRRNRIISGISQGVVIVEAARRSGTLITARFAAEQGREVMAVPGHPLDPRAEGTNGLIRGGATMITSADDVLEVLAPFWVAEASPAPGRRKAGLRDDADGATPATDLSSDVASAPAPSDEAASPTREAPLVDQNARDCVLALLGPAPVGMDDISRAAGLPVSAVRAALLELALAGHIEHHGSQMVSRRTT